MILRHHHNGVLAIGQQSHAWISGQLARAWGNERFGIVEPWEEVCLGAEQHDVGMAAWDLAPTRDPATGLPYSFMEMPLATHLELWREGPPRLVSQSRYAALLASMHGAGLYAQRDRTRLTDEQCHAVDAFLGASHAFQSELATSLSADPDQLARNSRLVWAWDFMSLALCLDWPPCTARDVPTAGPPTDVRLIPGREPCTVTFDPWPFRRSRVTIRCEGRLLTGRYADDESLAAALTDAPWTTLAFELSGG